MQGLDRFDDLRRFRTHGFEMAVWELRCGEGHGEGRRRGALRGVIV